MLADLDKYTYWEKVDFFFGKVPTDPPFDFYLMSKINYSISPKNAVHFMIKLLKSSKMLPLKYRLLNIDQGFWFLMGVDGVTWCLNDDSVPIRSRKECILAMPTLFKDVFYLDSGRGDDWMMAGHMWWDHFFSYINLDKIDCNINGHSADILISACDAILIMYNQPYKASKQSALHGLEHLKNALWCIKSEELKSILSSWIQKISIAAGIPETQRSGLS